MVRTIISAYASTDVRQNLILTFICLVIVGALSPQRVDARHQQFLFSPWFAPWISTSLFSRIDNQDRRLKKLFDNLLIRYALSRFISLLKVLRLLLSVMLVEWLSRVGLRNPGKTAFPQERCKEVAGVGSFERSLLFEYWIYCSLGQPEPKDGLMLVCNHSLIQGKRMGDLMKAKFEDDGSEILRVQKSIRDSSNTHDQLAVVILELSRWQFEGIDSLGLDEASNLWLVKNWPYDLQ